MIDWHIPIGRPLFVFAGGFSLVLFVATIALWVRTYYAQDVVAWTVAGYSAELHTARGHLTYHRQGLPAYLIRPDQPRWRWNHQASPPQFRVGPAFGMHVEDGWYWRGFGWTRLTVANGIIAHRFAYVPCWALAGAFLVLPLIWLAGYVRHRRHDRLSRKGMCPVCGYDLRATPSRCPECGIVPSEQG